MIYMNVDDDGDDDDDDDDDAGFILESLKCCVLMIIPTFIRRFPGATLNFDHPLATSMAEGVLVPCFFPSYIYR